MPAVSKKSRRGQVRLVLLSALGLAATRLGCAGRPPTVTPSAAAVGTGVSIRQVKAGAATVRVIDVDLGAPGVRVDVAADDIALREG